jgi:K+-sensing histidine kinase KdpD
MLRPENAYLFSIPIKASMIKVKSDAEMIINPVLNDMGHGIEEEEQEDDFTLFTAGNQNEDNSTNRVTIQSRFYCLKVMDSNI